MKNTKKLTKNFKLLIIAFLLAILSLVSYMASDYEKIKTSILPSAKIESKENKPVEQTPKSNTVKEAKISETTAKGNVELKIGDLNLKFDAVENKSLYDVLTEMNSKGTLNLTLKEYSGIGFYVTEIGTLKEYSGKHLLYYVNGKEATSGILLYVPKQGDSIEWKLE